MSGQTNNTDILAALNQQIQAINDLVTAIGNLVLSVNVEPADPAVNVNCTPMVSPVINLACGGASAGSEFVSPSGDEGGTPPPGYTEPDPNTVNRKCKAANAIWTTVDSILAELITAGVENYAGLGVTVTAGLLGAVIGSAAPPFGTLVGAVLGVVVGVLGLLVVGGFSLSNMRTALSTYQEDLVCVLYTSTDADLARSAFLGVLTDAAAINTIESTILGYLLPTNLVNLLYFSSTADVETSIDEANINVVCEACTETCAWQLDQGTGTILIGSQFTLTAAEDPVNHFYYVSLGQTEACCPTNHSVTVIHETRAHPNGAGLQRWHPTENCPAVDPTWVWNTNGNVADATQGDGMHISFLDTVGAFTVTLLIDTNI